MNYYYNIAGLKQSLVNTKSLQKKGKYKGTFSMACRQRGSHARSVYPIQDTSRMRTARIKQEEEADNGIIVKE